MSESKILTAQEVGEIEAHLKRWDRGEVSKQTFPVNWKNADALCATVRHLLSENERAAKHLGDYDQLVGHLRQENARLKADVKRFSELADERHDQLWEARRQRDDLAAKCAPYLETLN